MKGNFLIWGEGVYVCVFWVCLVRLVGEGQFLMCGKVVTGQGLPTRHSNKESGPK